MTTLSTVSGPVPWGEATRTLINSFLPGNPIPQPNGKTDHNTDKIDPCKHYIIGKAFYAIIRPMQLFGVTTLSVVGRGEEYKSGTYWTFVWTLVTLAFILTLLLVYALNSFGISEPVQIFASYLNDVVMDMDNTGNGTMDLLTTSPKAATTSLINDPNFFIHVTLSLRFIIPYSTLISGLLGILWGSHFSNFLNNWTEFSKRLDDTFSPYYQINFEDVPRARVNYFYLFFSPMMVLALITTPYLALSGTIVQLGEDHFIAGIVGTVLFTTSLVIIRILCNMKDFLSLVVLAAAYRELRHGAQAQFIELRDHITKSEVQGWLRLVMFIRDQGRLVQVHAGPQNIWFLVEVFVLILSALAASTLAILQDRREYAIMVATYILLSVAVIGFLFWKAHLAEAITFEEERFMEVVVAMTGTNNCETRMEMKSLCDMMLHDPFQISFGNVMVLTKRLILAFCSQLAATLIILLQFVSH